MVHKTEVNSYNKNNFRGFRFTFRNGANNVLLEAVTALGGEHSGNFPGAPKSEDGLESIYARGGQMGNRPMGLLLIQNLGLFVLLICLSIQV